MFLNKFLRKSQEELEAANQLSLQEINNTVEIPKEGSFFKKVLAYSGPGALVAVGYMDPGNWITSIAGGAQYAYSLLFVILISNLIAMLLQSMSVRLGIVTGMDLAQATRKHTGKKMGFVLWIITELAIMATDIAEIIGSAVALKLLFGIPLLLGVIITIFDVFLLLLLAHFGFRKIEAIVSALIFTILIIFFYEVLLANPNTGELIKGFIPNKDVVGNKGAHNLYLHSSIVQARRYDRKDNNSKREAIRFSTIDSNIQLSIAFVINCLLLVLGAALFYGHGDSLGRFTDLYNALQDSSIVGSIASPVLSVLFAIALLASGQNSTITGTLSGQIVMEGFIHLRIPMWVRRMLTRVIAVMPVVICLIIFGDSEQAIESLLIYTQVFLSIALPISIIPLTLYTSDKKLMGEFVIKPWMKILAWICTVILIILNFWLIISTFI